MFKKILNNLKKELNDLEKLTIIVYHFNDDLFLEINEKI